MLDLLWSLYFTKQPAKPICLNPRALYQSVLPYMMKLLLGSFAASSPNCMFRLNQTVYTV